MIAVATFDLVMLLLICGGVFSLTFHMAVHSIKFKRQVGKHSLLLLATGSAVALTILTEILSRTETDYRMVSSILCLSILCWAWPLLLCQGLYINNLRTIFPRLRSVKRSKSQLLRAKAVRMLIGGISFLALASLTLVAADFFISWLVDHEPLYWSLL